MLYFDHSSIFCSNCTPVFLHVYTHILALDEKGPDGDRNWELENDIMTKKQQGKLI